MGEWKQILLVLSTEDDLATIKRFEHHPFARANPLMKG